MCFECRMYVSNASAEVGTAHGCIVTRQHGAWTELAAEAHARAELVSVLFADVDASTIDVAAFVRTLRAQHVAVGAAAMADPALEAMRPVQACARREPDAISTGFAVFSASAFLCWQEWVASRRAAAAASPTQVEAHSLVLADASFRQRCNTSLAVLDQHVVHAATASSTHDDGGVAQRSWRHGTRRLRTPHAQRTPCVARSRLHLASDKYYLLVTHRGGWRVIIESLINAEVLLLSHVLEREVVPLSSRPPHVWSRLHKELLFVDCAEVLFIHQRVTLKTPWIGVIHTVGDLPRAFADEDTVHGLLADGHFLASLPACKLIITHTLALARYLRALPILAGVPLRAIPHPMGLADAAPQFDLDAFVANAPSRMLILLGSQYRRVATIYTVRTRLRKAWLPGGGRDIGVRQQRMFAAAMAADGLDARLHANGSACLARGCDTTSTITRSWDVQIMYTSEEGQYDALVLRNLVVIDLIAASANNAVLEAISMNNPVLICKLPAVVEYLGESYPLYFSDVLSLESLLNDTRLEARVAHAHAYLRRLDKRRLSLGHFAQSLRSAAEDVLSGAV